MKSYESELALLEIITHRDSLFLNFYALDYKVSGVKSSLFSMAKN